MTTEERLEKLEREIEAMKTAIRTKSLCVLDDQGRERVTLAVGNDDVAGLAIMDENEKIRAVMAVDKEGPKLIVSDENNESRAEMAVDKEGVTLVMVGTSVAGQVKLCADKNGPGLFMTDENEKIRAGMAVDKENGPVLGLLDANGKDSEQKNSLKREVLKEMADGLDKRIKKAQSPLNQQLWALGIVVILIISLFLLLFK